MCEVFLLIFVHKKKFLHFLLFFIGVFLSNSDRPVIRIAAAGKACL